MQSSIHIITPQPLVDEWPYPEKFVATLINRTPAGFRWALSQSESTSAGRHIQFLKLTRKKIGRRSFWLGADLKKLVSGEFTKMGGESK